MVEVLTARRQEALDFRAVASEEQQWQGKDLEIFWPVRNKVSLIDDTERVHIPLQHRELFPTSCDPPS